MANLKQVGNGLAMYRDDYSGHMPYIWAGGTFFNLMSDYMKMRLGSDAKNVLKCPSAPWITQTHTSGGAHRCTDGYAYQLNESGWAPQSAYPSRPYCLAWGLNDAGILRPSQLIYIAEAMGWSGYGVAYWNGTNANNETATDDHAGSGGTGWQGYWPTNSEQIPFNGNTPGPRGGTVCKIYNLRVNHRGYANVLMYDGHVKSLASSLGKNWSNYNLPP